MCAKGAQRATFFIYVDRRRSGCRSTQEGTCNLSDTHATLAFILRWIGGRHVSRFDPVHTRLLPPPCVMTEPSLVADASCEGVFVTGVRTTGIFCGPTCPARKPDPEHLEFFPSAGKRRRPVIGPVCAAVPSTTSAVPRDGFVLSSTPFAPSRPVAGRTTSSESEASAPTGSDGGSRSTAA